MRAGSSRGLALLIGSAALVFFAAGALRHLRIRSTAYDLGVFDQALWLISTGAAPVSSILGTHILGDHAAPIWYVLALPYVVYPSVYWLLAIQALALALGAWPTYVLALDAGIPPQRALLMAGVYLLYPTLFAVSTFDFHPEVLAVPALLAAVLAARRRRLGWFCAAVAVILSCKAVLALTVAAMGVWLLCCERRPLHGVIAAGAGVAWFAIASLVVVPFYSGADAAHTMGDDRYARLGGTLSEIVWHVVSQPLATIAPALSGAALSYVAALASPVVWGLSPMHAAPLIGAAPQLMLNLLSSSSLQRAVPYQYQLPIVPFLVLATLSALAADRTWLRKGRSILAWCVLAFVALGGIGQFVRQLWPLRTRPAVRAAIVRLPPEASVLTDNCIAPQISHRAHLYVLHGGAMPAEGIPDVDFVLFDTRRPCHVDPAMLLGFLDASRRSGRFRTVSDERGVVLLARDG